MLEPTTSLYQYLQKEKIDDEKIIAHGLALIGMGFQRGQTLLKTAAIGLFVQKMRNETFIREIILIQEAFERRGLKVIFIKGVPLAEDIYCSAYTRRCGDIDIIVEYERVPESLEVLDSLGYYQAYNKGNEKEESITGEYYKKYIHEFGLLKMHFPVFQKRMFDENGKEKLISLDCHVCIFPNLPDYREKMGGCFQNAVPQLFHGHNILVLSLYHRMLHLITHFAKDTYRDNPFWIFTGWKKGYHSVKLNLLHDMALLLYKYENIFDWNEFYHIAKEFNQIIPVYYTLQFLKEIYGVLIPDDVEERMQDNFPQSKTFMETVLVSFGEREISEILFLDQYELMRDILPGVNFRGEISGNDFVKAFYIKTPSNMLKDALESRTLVKCSEYAKGVVYRKENGLQFSVCIFGGERYAPHYPSITIQVGDGSIIPEYQCITPRIQFIADRVEDEIRSRLLVGMNEYTLDYKSKISLAKGDLTIDLTLDRELLPIKYDRNIFFNVEIDERNEEGDNIRSAGVYMSHFNVANYASSCLKNSIGGGVTNV